MSKGILVDLRKSAGSTADYDEYFDSQLMMHANTLFTLLIQVGVGPESGFKVEDENTEWDDFYNQCSNPDDPKLRMVESYICLRTRIFFDPPTNTTLLQSLNDTVKELEWRLNVNTMEDNSNEQ